MIMMSGNNLLMDFKCRDAFINVPTSAHFPHGSRLLSILVPFTFPTLGFLTYNSGALSINFLIIIKSYLAFCGKNAYYFLDSISHPSSKWTSPLKIRSISYYESCHQDVGHLGLSVFLTIILIVNFCIISWLHLMPREKIKHLQSKPFFVI